MPNDLLEHADLLAGRRGHVVAAAELHHRAGLDPEELLGLVLVGEEADVLLDRHPLLPHERDRQPARRDPVEVHHRPDQLLDLEPIGVEDGAHPLHPMGVDKVHPSFNRGGMTHGRT